MTPDTARARSFFALYLCAVVYLSLYPWDFLLHAKWIGLRWAPLNSRRGLMDATLNVLLYVPLGAAGLLSVRRRWLGWAFALTAGCGLSAVIEWTQLWSTLRYGTYTDLLANSAGVAAGAWGAQFVERAGWLQRWHSADADSPWRIAPSTLPLFGAWILWQMFPFIPWISLSRLAALADLAAPWSWRTLGECFVGFATLRMALGRSHWLWAAYAALPAQALLMDRTLSPAAMTGAAVGWLVAQQGIWPKLRHALLLPLWLAYEEFRPFRLGPEHPIAWIPFGSWYDAPPGNYYAVVFGKLFLYVAIIWTVRLRGSSWLMAVGVPALIAAVGEWAQQYLEGRTPESTEVVLVLAAATLLALFEERREDRSPQS